jgi:hypothetical protein
MTGSGRVALGSPRIGARHGATRETMGLVEGTGQADTGRCMGIAPWSAPGKTTVPGRSAMILPSLVGGPLAGRRRVDRDPLDHAGVGAGQAASTPFR